MLVKGATDNKPQQNINTNYDWSVIIACIFASIFYMKRLDTMVYDVIHKIAEWKGTGNMNLTTVFLAKLAAASPTMIQAYIKTDYFFIDFVTGNWCIWCVWDLLQSLQYNQTLNSISGSKFTDNFKKRARNQPKHWS